MPLPMISVADLSGRRLQKFRRDLLSWYQRERRDLPWRKTRQAYRIWISEIMLQQTRVAAVLEYYRRFLARFPDLATLASTSEDKVLAAWSGLGYYRRARMLHRCAQQVMAEHCGRFPRTSDELRQLPGIGRYTAAAIASIAFHEPVAVVDGNVERVLQRMMGSKLVQSESWTISQHLLSRESPGDFNQAMMELGATICTPRQPACPRCPVRTWCASMGNAAAETPRTSQIRKTICCVLQRRDGHVRLSRRAKSVSLMAGMWELPEVRTPSVADARTVWKTLRHSITNTTYTVHVVREGAASRQGRWIALEDVPHLPITGLTRKILKADGII